MSAPGTGKCAAGHHVYRDWCHDCDALWTVVHKPAEPAEPTVTLPVAFLSRLMDGERIASHTIRDPTPWWFGEDYDAGCYTIPCGPATPDEIEAQRTLDAAIDALVAESS